MKIGIDVDDVLADFQSAFVEILHNANGRPPLGTHPVDWEWSNCEANKIEMAAAWAATRDIYDFWANIEALPSFDWHTVDLLRVAHSEHDVFFISNRYPTTGDSPTKQTGIWLYTKTGIIDPNIIITADKGPVAKALELDAFFDDRPKNCEEVLAAVPNARVFLCDSSHNQTYSNPSIPRLANLRVFLEEVL